MMRRKGTKKNKTEINDNTPCNKCKKNYGADDDPKS